MSEPAVSLPFAAEEVDPAAFFAGKILLTAPHQDDCVLAFGATMARLGGGPRFHVVYATDGADSPEPPLPWRDPRPEGLDAIRRQEALDAMDRLGVPAHQVHFLELPDRRLGDHGPRLRRSLRELLDSVRPDHVLAPFRFDRHSDHLALNHAVVDLHRERAGGGFELTEYFIYYQSRLLPRGDLRAYLRQGLLRSVPSGDFAPAKRKALDCFRSQTTRFYPWQTRPNLSGELLDAVSVSPEIFLRYDPTLPGAAVLVGPRLWIRIAHRLEPRLKRGKDQVIAMLRRSFGAAGGTEQTS